MKTQDKWNVEQKRGKNKNVLKNEKKKKKFLHRFRRRYLFYMDSYQAIDGRKTKLAIN